MVNEMKALITIVLVVFAFFAITFCLVFVLCKASDIVSEIREKIEAANFEDKIVESILLILASPLILIEKIKKFLNKD